jgi:hypothetical protein
MDVHILHNFKHTHLDTHSTLKIQTISNVQWKFKQWTVDGQSNKGQSNTMDKHLDTRNIQKLELSTLDTKHSNTTHSKALKQPWSTKQHFKTSKWNLMFFASLVNKSHSFGQKFPSSSYGTPTHWHYNIIQTLPRFIILLIIIATTCT